AAGPGRHSPPLADGVWLVVPEGPPVSTSEQFAPAGSRFSQYPTDTASSHAVRSWGLRRAQHAVRNAEFPSWHHDHQRQVAVTTDGNRLIASAWVLTRQRTPRQATAGRTTLLGGWSND